MGQIHASCVAINGVGVIIRGPSGSGKSDLALRLIDEGATLVADDYCNLTAENGRLIVTPPQTIAGKIEVRGYGIITLPLCSSVAAGLVVDLMPHDEIERMPEETMCTLEHVTLRRLVLNGFAASSPAKIRLVLDSPS
jgi:HPr kinase/phosphorylase